MPRQLKPVSDVLIFPFSLTLDTAPRIHRYRAHVQEQIKQDRLERQQRHQQQQQQQQQHDENRRKQLQEQQEQAERRKAQNSISANIMFRLPDGSTVTNLFGADDSFIRVRH